VSKRLIISLDHIPVLKVFCALVVLGIFLLFAVDAYYTPFFRRTVIVGGEGEVRYGEVDYGAKPEILWLTRLSFLLIAVGALGGFKEGQTRNVSRKVRLSYFLLMA
jgi:hypothetical protein